MVWRKASTDAVNRMNFVASTFQDFLCLGGPDAVRSLRTTVKKLQLELKESKSSARGERFTRLQTDLKADRVRKALRSMLNDKYNLSEDEIDTHLSAGVFKDDRLYGSSRARNSVLRHQRMESAFHN
eukprot:gene8305-1577_t